MADIPPIPGTVQRLTRDITHVTGDLFVGGIASFATPIPADSLAGDAANIVEIIITSEQIQNLHNVPINLLAGIADTSIIVQSVKYTYVPGTVPYTGGGNIALAYSVPDIGYIYDPNGRLKQVVYKDGTTITYAYDLMGNRTSVVVAAGTPPGILSTAITAATITSATLPVDLVKAPVDTFAAAIPGSALNLLSPSSSPTSSTPQPTPPSNVPTQGSDLILTNTGSPYLDGNGFITVFMSYLVPPKTVTTTYGINDQFGAE